jgi:hypothetical protein
MAWESERGIKRGNLTALIDSNTATQKIRVGIYKGDTLLVLDIIQPLETRIETAFARAKAMAPSFPNGHQPPYGEP